MRPQSDDVCMRVEKLERSHSLSHRKVPKRWV